MAPVARRARSALAIASACALCAATPVAAGSSAAPTIATIAGSGAPGVADGPALSATFLAPAALAVAPDGTIAIADTAARRIRTLRAGAVATLAGGGEIGQRGGYVAGLLRMGSGAAARFRSPSGLAFLRDGTLLVADTGDHCIRSISRGGPVPVYAGSLRLATSDGTLRAASFAYPQALAVDDAGTIYVGDLTGGLRTIVNGRVSTIALPAAAGTGVPGVATIGRGAEERIFVSTFKGLAILDAAHVARFYAGATEGARPFGYPDALLALRSDAAIFTDTRDRTVRLFREPLHPGDPPLVVPLPIDVPEDGPFAGGGLRDGPLRGARFDSPLGIARAANGDLLIADTGNRRIRAISGDVARLPYRTSDALPAGRTWIVGGPPSYYDTLWSESIAGHLGTRVPDADALEYDDADTRAASAALARVQAAHPARTIWLITTRDLATLGADAVAAAARGAGDGLTIATLPLSEELAAPRNFAQLSLASPAELARARARYDGLVAAVRASGARVLDLRDALVSAPPGADVYATRSNELSDAGRAVVAAALLSAT